MKKFKRFINMSVWAGLAISPVAMASEYQSEIAYQSTYRDYDGLADDNLGALKYMYHFDKVNTDNKPLAEAAYLERSSSFEAALFGNVLEYNDGSEIVGGGLWFEYIKMDKNSPLLFEVAYSPASYEARTASGATVYEWDTTTLEFTAGWFVDRTTAVAATISKTDYAYTTPGYASNDYDTTDLYLEAKRVVVSGDGTSINMEAKIVKVEYRNNSNMLLGIAGDYYLDHKKSIGGFYESESGDEKDSEGSTIGIRGRFFFTDQFSLAAHLSSFSASDTTGTDYNETNLELNYRF